MNFDVIVVGGGFAGASAAYFLAPHASVLLIEREAALATQSSGRSAEQFTVGISADLMRAVGAASRSFFDQAPEGFCEGPLLSRRAVLTVGRQEQSARLDKLEERLKGVGADAIRLSGTEALALFPALKPEGVELGVLEPGAADIDSHRLLQGYVRGARALGAELMLDCAVTEIRRRTGGWTVETTKGSFETGFIVNAAGAWVDEIAALAGIEPVGVRPMRRTAFTFAAPPGITVDHWPHVFKIDRQWYLKPETGRFMGSLAEEVLVPPGDVYPEDLDVAQAISNIEADTDLSIGRPLSTWAGLRNFLADRDPVSGSRAADPTFVWIAGQGGCGVLTSPALGQAAAASVLQEPLPASMSAYGIDQAALSPDRLGRASGVPDNFKLIQETK